MSETADPRVVIGDRLDVTTVTRYRRDFRAALAAGAHGAVVDMSEVTVMDVAGLAALMSLLLESRQAGGTVRLVGPFSPQVERLLRLAGSERLFRVDALGPARGT